MSAYDTPEQISRASLSDVVYQRLRDAIMNGEVEDGSRLSQVQLAKKYGVSRIPVREALRRLQAESLVIATPYYPFVVRNVTSEHVLELVDIRAILEDFALSRRAPLSDEELAQLDRLNAQMKSDSDGRDFLTIDREFHRLIAGPGTRTLELIDDIRNKVHRYLNIMVKGKPRRAAAIREHAKIITALKAKDMELARELMRDHVLRSRAYIIDKLKAEAAGTPTEE